MHTRRPFRPLLITLPFCAAATVAVLLAAQGTDTAGDPLVAGFKSTYPASVSDAVELVTGKNGTMRYDMKLMTGANLVGRAVTALARPAAAAEATPALSTRHSVEMIDEAKPGEVGVIVMEGTLDIAAMGNLMATAAVERGMAGMVLDGAIRDLWDVRRMGLTVFARSKSPRTAVGHYATVAKNVPVECAGVTVRATSSSPMRTGWSWCRRNAPLRSSRRPRPSTTASAACIRLFANSNRCRRPSANSTASEAGSASAPEVILV
jgi:regulator of RNase E activity RraA